MSPSSHFLEIAVCCWPHHVPQTTSSCSSTGAVHSAVTRVSASGVTNQVLAALLTVLEGPKSIVGRQGRYRNGPDALTHGDGLHGIWCSQSLLHQSIKFESPTTKAGGVQELRKALLATLVVSFSWPIERQTGTRGLHNIFLLALPKDCNQRNARQYKCTNIDD